MTPVGAPTPVEFEPPSEDETKVYLELLLTSWQAAQPPGAAPPTVDTLLDWAEEHPDECLAATQLLFASRNGGAPGGGTPAERGGARAAAARAAPRPSPRPPAFVLATPTPGFVVKTRDAASGRKVMLNVCGCDAVPAPGDWAGGHVPLAVREALRSGEHSDANALRFPLSCGEAREASLASQASSSAVAAAAPPPAVLIRPSAPSQPPLASVTEPPVLVFDVAFASAVVSASLSDAKLRALLATTSLAAVCAKHKVSLDDKYKLPLRSAYDPPLRPQRVRVDGAAPRICELGEATPPPPPAAAAAAKPRPAPTPRGAAPSAVAPAVALAPARAAPASSAAATPPLPTEPPSSLRGSLSFEGRPVAFLNLEFGPLPLSLLSSPAAFGGGQGGACAWLRVRAERGSVSVSTLPPLPHLACSVALPFETDAAGAKAWVEEALAAAAAAAAAAQTQNGVAERRCVLKVRLPVVSYARWHREAMQAASPFGGAGAAGISKGFMLG